MTRRIRVDQIDDVFRDAVIKLVKKTKNINWSEFVRKNPDRLT